MTLARDPQTGFFIEMGLGMKQLVGCMAYKKTDEEDQKDDEDEEHEVDEEKDQANEEEDDEHLGDKNNPPWIRTRMTQFPK